MHSIIGRVFAYNVDYDELINELYVHIMENDAARLRTFSYNSTIYQWIKTVAIRYFQQKRDRIIEDQSKETPYINGDSTDPHMGSAISMDLKDLISRIDNPRYRLVLQKLLLEDMEPASVAKQMGVTIANLYNIKKRAMDAFLAIAEKSDWHKGSVDILSALASAAHDRLCAVHCERYVLQYFGISTSVEELVSYGYDQCLIMEEGTPLSNVGKIAEHYGLSIKQTFASGIQEIESALSANRQVIVAIDVGELDPLSSEYEYLEDCIAGPRPDHCVVVLSCDPSDGEVVCYDPSAGEIPISIPIPAFLDAWQDSRNYMIVADKTV